MKVCPICKTNRFEKEFFNPEEGIVYLCQTCGLGIFDGPMPTYAGADIEENFVVKLVKKIILWHEFGYLKKRSAAKILDIGSGSGVLAAYLQSQGHTVWCCDIDQASLDRVKKDFGLKTIQWDVTTPVNFKEKFDLIILRHVFEHFDDPLTVLNSLKQLLKKKSSIVFTQPQFSSWSRRLNKYIWQWATPWHRFFWTQKSLKALLEKEGFLVTKSKGIFSPFGLPVALAKTIRPKALALLTMPITIPLGIILEIISIPFKGSNNMLVEAQKVDS